MKYNKPSRSNEVPDYIASGLTNTNNTRRLALLEESKSGVKNEYSSGRMSTASFMQHVPNIRHGAGTFESKSDMSIWEVRGESIFRRKDRTMEVEAVLYALDSSEEKENNE